ncbi:hypothetical protein GCM10027289_27700 [Tsukamurella serpentis]
MHEYQRFVQSELDARGWRQTDLVRRSGLSRQLVSNILRDNREHLGQMPDAATITGLARGFGIPAETVRIAAARSLADYSDDGTALTITLNEVSTDALLNEIRRRINHAATSTSVAPAPPKGTEDPPRQTQKTPGQVRNLADRRRKPPPLPNDEQWAARDLGHEPVGRKIRRRQDEAGELPDPDGPEGGA